MTPEHMTALHAVRGLAERMNRAYDAAASNNYNADFKGTYGAPNSEILSSEYVASARARTIAKDTPHGKAIVRTFQDNVVGPNPFKLEMKVGKFDAKGKFTEERELNRAVEAGWKEFCRRKNFTASKTMSMMEGMRAVEAELVTVGRVIGRHYRGYEFNDFGYAVDFFEKDRLQSAFNGRDDEGNPIRFSVSRHPVYNFPIYYHLLTRHPGEVFGGVWSGGTNRQEKIFREKVEARDIVDFNNLRNRVEQDCGFTELDATVQPLWRLHQYEKALTLASIASAAKPFWLQKNVPNGFVIPEGLKEGFMNAPGLAGDAPNGGGDPVAAQNGAGTPAHQVTPGAREEFPPGYELKQADPKFPIEGAHEFRQDNSRDIAIGTGVAYQHATGDFQNLGFIAGLMCMIPFHEYAKVRQNNLIDGGLDAIFAEWLRSCLMVGYFEKHHGIEISLGRLEEILTCAHFKGRGFPFVNPVVQAQALILLHNNGHLTRQQVQDALPDGMTVEKVAEDLKNEQEEFKDIVLPGQGDMTRPNAEDGGEEPQPPAKSKPGNPLRSRSRGGIDPMTQVALEMSVNGEH